MSKDDFDVDELADYLHLTPAQIVKMASRDRLPGRRVGSEWRFPRAEIHHWLEDRIGASDEDLVHAEQVIQKQDKKEGDSETDVSMERLLHPDAIIVPLEARTRTSVISAICKHCADIGLIWEPEKMAEAIRQRENLHSTALDNGLALLHPRRPLPNIIGEPFLALGRTHGGIPFGGPRGQSTDIFFLIASVDDKGHLRTLARLSRLIANPELVAAIRTAETAAEIYQLIIDLDRATFSN